MDKTLMLSLDASTLVGESNPPFSAGELELDLKNYIHTATRNKYVFFITQQHVVFFYKLIIKSNLFRQEMAKQSV